MYLKNHFNEHLHDKVYNTFYKLLGSINVESTKEALPKASIYNDTIGKVLEENNSGYNMVLTLMHLEPCEVGH